MLRVLSEFEGPVGSTLAQTRTKKEGISSQRKNSDDITCSCWKQKGFVLGHERKGRTITSQGLEELSQLSCHSTSRVYYNSIYVIGIFSNL